MEMKYVAKVQKYMSSIGFFWEYYTQNERGDSFSVESIENAKFFTDKRSLKTKIINDPRFKRKIMVIEEVV